MEASMYSPPRRDPGFDWATDDSVILERRSALAVYVNSRAEVVLRMQAEWNEDDDSFVAFPFNDAEMVASRIMDLVRNPGNFHNAPRRCPLTETAEPKHAEAPPAAGAETLLDRMEGDK
jgi:hypothetical protein